MMESSICSIVTGAAGGTCERSERVVQGRAGAAGGCGVGATVSSPHAAVSASARSLG